MSIFRRYTFKSIFVIGCGGADGYEGEVHYPGHIDVIVDCGKTKRLGRYFALKWTVSKFLIKRLVRIQYQRSNSK